MTRRKLFFYVGNRGIVLGLLGVIWVLTAVGLAIEPITTPGLLYTQIPVPIQFVFWFVPGFVAIISVAVRRMDEWAWFLMILPIAVRFFSFLAAWILGTYPLGWRGAAVYAATGLLVNRCAAGLDRPAPWDGRERREWMTPQR